MYIFSPNTLIKSAEVNANFTEITSTYTYKHQMLIKADNVAGGGALDSSNFGSPEIAFTGTPTNYGRCSGILPVNYAGGTIAIKIYLYSGSNNNQNLNYYVGGWANNGTISTWNIQSNQTYSSINLSANTLKEITLYTISAGVLSAGNLVAIAIRPASAITGTIWYASCWLEYTANYK